LADLATLGTTLPGTDHGIGMMSGAGFPLMEAPANSGHFVIGPVCRRFTVSVVTAMCLQLYGPVSSVPVGFPKLLEPVAFGHVVVLVTELLYLLTLM
jgi:hypothetical protein